MTAIRGLKSILSCLGPYLQVELLLPGGTLLALTAIHEPWKCGRDLSPEAVLSPIQKVAHETGLYT